ncbi:MAG: ABC transporter permease [Actinomycetota bacterium]|nr:ABC transporter permease [Actinomycetota bacterium]
MRTEGTAAPPSWVDRLLTVNAWAVYVFLYAPIVLLILLSFNSSRFAGIWEGFTLEWYREMFANDQVMQALRNSVIVALVSTAIATVLGTAAALGLDRYRKWVGKRPFDALLYLPVIIPDVTMAVMLLMFFASLSWTLSLTTIIISHIAFSISFVAIVVRARLSGLDPAIEEAASDLYANRWRTFQKVTLPLIAPGVVGGALLALTLSLDDVVITSFVQGPGSTTLPVLVFSMIKRGVTPVINAVSSIMLLASMLFVFAALAFQRR